MPPFLRPHLLYALLPPLALSFHLNTIHLSCHMRGVHTVTERGREGDIRLNLQTSVCAHLHSQPPRSPYTSRRPSALSTISHPVRPVLLLHIVNCPRRRTITATRCPPCLFSPRSSIEYPSIHRQRRLVETHENLHLQCYQRFALIRVQCNTVQLDGRCDIGRGLSRSSNVPRPDPKGLVVQAKPGVCGLAGRASDFCSGPDLSGWPGDWPGGGQ